jgi:eukaryotic-like serine/threonine-protein kinase
MTETATATPARPVGARYVLHERLGGGGQGEVWRAHDPERGIDIALKILHPGPGRSGAAWQALVHEHDSASRLNHPNILKVYKPEREGATFLLPMELASGGDLGRLRGAGYLSIVPVLIEVAEALEHAHDHGVIHRDLKPGNVLFDARGRVKLADFGVSGRAPDPGTDAMIRGLSPFTASPEQLRGEPPTPADDIYGLGALAYELLSRYPPHYPNFDARRVQEEPAPPLVPTEQIPPQLAALVARMLAKDPRERPASMGGVIAELQAALNDTLTYDFETAEPPREAPPANPTGELDDGLLATRPPQAPPATTPALTIPTPAVPSPAVRAALPRPVPRRRSSDVRAAPVPGALAPGVVDGQALWEELRQGPAPRLSSRYVTMPNATPRAIVLVVGLAAAVVAAFLWLPRHGSVLPMPVPEAAPATPPPSEAANSNTVPPALPLAGTAPSNAAAPSNAVSAHPAPVERAPPVKKAGAGAGGAVAARSDAELAPGPARTALVKTTAAFGDDGYAKAAGEGFAALGAGRLDEARAAFERARALRPDGAEAIEGLRRVKAAAGAHSIAVQRAHAADLETQERWDEAIRVYEDLLREDSSLAFAQAGRARAADRLLLGESLDALIDRPERLSSPQVRDQAIKLLQEAEEQPDAGPLLSSQIARLSALVPGLDKPVHLSLVSDNLTQVAITSVGTFGSFGRRDIELKPGHYTVIGTRDGYREVRRDITVSPGEDNRTVNISCYDPI